MTLKTNHNEIVRDLLKVEHSSIAYKLEFIPTPYDLIDNELLYRTIGMLDELSRVDDEISRKVIIMASAILWSYKDNAWDGLREYLLLILSRSGFAPSSIMIDEKYGEDSKFESFSSFVNELYTTIYHIKNEIIIQNKKFLLTRFQKEVWSKLEYLKLLGISAPTSAGKSFIILLKAMQMLCEKEGNVIYVVPTLSLVAQVSADFNTQLKQFGLHSLTIATTYNSNNLDHNKIYVLTQEKAISAFTQEDIPFKNVRLLIIDEIQNIERVANDDDQRAKVLYDTLIELRHTCEPDLTIISGPRIDGLKQLGIDIFNIDEVDEEKTKESPVASLTYSISKSGNRYFFNQYTDIIDYPNKIAISDSSFIKDYGGSIYKESFLSYLSRFVKNLGLDSRNIIFSPTSLQARKTAMQLAELREPINENDEVESLITYLKETIHDDYDMCFTIPRGFVYHHGKTPSNVRAVIERAIRNKLIPNIVCTTTLMQGVNLPAQNVILRNPDLATRNRNGVKPKLTDYEIANLRGRAGRL